MCLRMFPAPPRPYDRIFSGGERMILLVNGVMVTILRIYDFAVCKLVTWLQLNRNYECLGLVFEAE